jgi:release factor glutamine methyltransferase
MSGLTLVAAWTRARRALEAAGIETPVLDARLLVERAAGVDRLALITDPHRPVGDEAEVVLDSLISRRVTAREPMAYILGKREFRGLMFETTPAVLIPRPDTETLVEVGLRLVENRAAPRILDIGTGTGAVGLSLLQAKPFATAILTDISPDAVAVASRNADALSLSDRAQIAQGSWTAGAEGLFDLIVSNPPYVRTGDIAGLEADVRDHEPHLALDGGADGLDAYRAILIEAPALLAPGGGMAVEIGFDQAEEVAALFEAASFSEIAVTPDLEGRARVVSGRRIA